MSTQINKCLNSLEGNSNLLKHFPQENVCSLDQSILQYSGEYTGNIVFSPTNWNYDKTEMMSVLWQAALWRKFTQVENLDLKLSEDDDSLRSLLVSLSHPPFPPSPLSLRHNGLYPSISVTMLYVRLCETNLHCHYMTGQHASINI